MQQKSVILEAISSEAEKPRVFRKEKVVNGKPARVECLEINGQTYCLDPGLVRVASLEEEWYEDVNHPDSVIVALAASDLRPDIFTFWQRVPETEPRYQYYTEWESLAVLPITTFDCWWNKQAKGTTRNMVRKSQKAGVEVREATFDDEFVRGMVDIFNEAPVRQGFRFWHYGKDFETVKREFSQFLFREDLIGAYYEGELIGFAMLANAGKYGVMGQFIAKMKHRDKATNNALMAKTIEVCEKRRLPYLVYTTWRETSLVDFKRHSGFQEMKVPRYFVPLTPKGKLALKLGFHHGLKDGPPDAIKKPLKRLRKRWYDLRWRSASSAKNSSN
jgi:hypothetical protein